MSIHRVATKLTVVALILGVTITTRANEGESPVVLDHEVKTLAGKPADLSDYKGKVVLIVNVASKCGATPQYEPLQALHEKYKDQGFAVLGFPCNQFGMQEPGSSQEISTFCTENYGVTFPMFEKIDVNGEQASPLYKELTSETAFPTDSGPIRWNFEKFLIDRNGKVVQRFRTKISPDSKEVVAAIEAALQNKNE